MITCTPIYTGPIVQRIVCKFPELEMVVRFHLGLQNDTARSFYINDRAVMQSSNSTQETYYFYTLV